MTRLFGTMVKLNCTTLGDWLPTVGACVCTVRSTTPQRKTAAPESYMAVCGKPDWVGLRSGEI